jgi:hypothetical protein
MGSCPKEEAVLAMKRVKISEVLKKERMNDCMVSWHVCK